ncbi:MAG: hypothetical protein JRD43_06630 [Deltaproteobacteria bacterium]|nr:hypothetical protein [Deltaproteobacteria bacterium]MBW2647528.1 hypothetical protein [Deltaproteobacteria bacterium]
MAMKGEKGDVVGALAIVVLLAGVSLCMINTSWFPWVNGVGFLIALGTIIFLKKRPAQKMPGFQRTSKGGMG